VGGVSVPHQKGANQFGTDPRDEEPVSMSSQTLANLEANPNDQRAFDQAAKEFAKAGDRDAIESLLDILAGLGKGQPTSESVLRQLMQLARTADDADFRSWLYYRTAIFYVDVLDEKQMAEVAFRKIETMPDDDVARGRVYDFYVDFYAAQNNWRKLEQVLADPQYGVDTSTLAVQRKLANIAESQGQPDKALSFWQAVRKEDPSDEEADSRLHALYTSLQRWNNLVDLLKDRHDRLDESDLDGRILTQLELVELYRDKMNAPARVIQAWQAILEIHPENAQALDALVEVYTAQNRWQDLVKILNEKVSIAGSVSEQVAHLEQIASIYRDKFSNLNEAVRTFDRILDVDPTNREALAESRVIYGQQHNYDAYVAISERELEFIDDPAQKHAELVKLAALASEKLRKPETPVALWLRVLDGEPNHDKALVELEGLYERERRWEELADILERRVQLETDTAQIVAVLDKLGTIVASRLEDAERSTEVWKRILAHDREHRKSHTELRKKFLAERDWDELEWFFRSYGDLGEWVRTIEGQLKHVDDEEERTELLYQIAAVYRDELDDTRRAVKSLETILEINPGDPVAARMLVPIYQQLGSWTSLPNVYEILLDATDDPHERKQVLLASADVQQSHLRNEEAAFFAFVQAVSENPEDVTLHPRLKGLAEATANWESYVVVLQDGVDHIADDEAKVAVLLEVGEVYSNRLGADDISLTFFNRVLAYDPHNPKALDASEAAWEATGQMDQLIVCYQRRLGMRQTPPERLETLSKLARVWREQIGANDEAEAVLRDILDEYQDEQPAYERLVEILTEEGRYADLYETLLRKRDLFERLAMPAESMADLECQLGMLTYATRESDSLEGVIERYEAALGFEQHHTATVTRLEELLGHDEYRLRIATDLVPVYENAHAWAKLSQMLEVQYLAAVEEDDAAAQISLLERLAEIYTARLADDDLTWRTFGRLFSLRPDTAAVRASFEGLTFTLDRWLDLVAIYPAFVEEASAPESRIAILMAVAKAYRDNLAAPAESRAFFDRVLEEEPSHDEALQALEVLLSELADHEALLAVYGTRIELATDNASRIDYLFKSSDLLRDELERPEDAIAPCEDALLLAPGDVGVVTRLDELFTITQRWDDLAHVIEQTLGIVASDTPRVIALRLRLASVLETHLERSEEAVRLYASVFDLDADDASAVEALERLFEDAELAPLVAPVLEPYYTRHERWARLVDTYVVREANEFNPAEKVAWNYRMAELLEGRLDMPSEAFGAFQAAAVIEPGSELTLSELLRLADSLEAQGELIVFLQNIVEDISALDRRIETHRTIAILARDKTGDLRGAESQFRALLEMDPSDLPAVDDLIELYRVTDNHESLVEMLLKKAPMVGADTTLRNALYGEAGDIASDALDDAPQAIEIFETLHNFDSESARALNALEALYTRTTDWDNVIRVLRLKIDRAPELADRKALAAQIAEVQYSKLEAPDDAIQTWQGVFDWDTNDRRALDELDLLYSLQEDWFNLRQTVVRLQELVAAEEWQSLQFRIARLFENQDQLADVHQAIACLATLLDKNPEHAGAINALEVLVAESDAYQPAFDVLRPVLEVQDRFEGLWTHFQVLVARFEDEPDRFVANMHDVAGLAEHKLRDVGRAFDSLARGFNVAPRSEKTIAELERLAAEDNRWEQLVDLYLGHAEGTDDEYLALAQRLRSGSILIDNVGDLARATETYETIRADHSEHAETLARLHELYEKQDRWDDLATTIRQQAELQGNQAVRIAFLEKFAGIAEESIGDTERAYDAWTEILDLDRSAEVAITALRRFFEGGVHSLDIAERLEPLYREQERWDELDSLLQLKLQLTDEAGDRLQLMRDIALLALDKRDNKGEALDWYGQALQLDPEDEGIYGEVNRLANETGEFAALGQYLLDAAEVAEDDERKVTLWHRAALNARDAAADLSEAERVWRLVVGTDPKNAPAWRALDEIVVAGERWEDLEEVLVSFTTADDVFDDEAMVVWARLGALYRDRLDRPTDSIAAWRQVLEIRDGNLDALKALQALYQTSEAWPELFETLQRLADLEQDVDTRVNYYADMAQIAEVALEDEARAIELWEEVLIGRPGDVTAIRELQRLQLGGGNYQGLAEALEREIQVGAADGARRLEVLVELGRIWRDNLDDPYQSLAAWERARTLAPASREVLDSLHALQLDAGNDMARTDVLEAKLVSDAYDPTEELAIWRELAEVRTDVFGDQPKATEAWRAVLAAAPGDTDAIANLESLYESGAKWQDLVDLQRMRIDLSDDAEDKTAFWLQIGGLYADNLANPEAAAAAYRELLAFDPAEPEASRRLEVLHERAGAWAEVAQVLLARSEVLTDASDKLFNLQRLATVYETNLESPTDALVVHQMGLEIAPDEPQILMEFERLAELTEEWATLQSTYESILPRLEDDAALEVMVKSADAVRYRLGDEETAIAYYDRVRATYPEHEKALRELVDLNGKFGHWDALVENLTVLAEVTPDYVERKTLLCRIAEVHEVERADTEAAVVAWESVYEADEMDLNAITNLERLHIAREAWDDLIGAYDRRIGLEPQREVEYRLQIADLLERYVRRTDDAVAAYEEVLSLDPANAKALERLEAVYVEREDFDSLLAVYERAYDGAPTAEDRLRLAKNSALIQQDYRHDSAAAAESWQRVLMLAPRDEDAFDALVRIHTAQAEWDELVRVWEQRYESSQGPDARAEALARAAAVYRDQIDDPQNAIATYERVLYEDRTHRDALGNLDHLYETEGMWDQLIENVDRILAVEMESVERARLRCRQGDVLVREMDDTYRATDCYRKALVVRPGDPHAIEALLKILRSEERWQETVDILEHKLAHTPQAIQRADVHVEIAELLVTQLARPEDALSHFELAEKANPDSRRALEALAEHYMRTEAWAPAMTRLEALIDRLDPERDREQLARTLRNHGLCAAALYLDDQAIESLSQSEALGVVDLETLRGLGRIYYKKGQFTDAERYMQQVLDGFRDDLSSDDQVEVLILLGESALKSGNPTAARRYLTQVVEEQPTNAQALEQIIEVLKLNGEWSTATGFMTQLLALKSDKLESFRLLMDMGDVYETHLKDTAHAAESYRSALRLEVFPKEPALKLVNLSVNMGDFEGAIENLNRCIRYEDDEKRKASFAHMAAVIQRENLNSPLEAVKYFNVALDHDLEKLAFFADIEKILTREQEPKMLEQNYRRMIQRLHNAPPTLAKRDEVLFQLYYGLGEIYRSRLKQVDKAIASFELAREKRPDDMRIREILASLYESTPDGADKAIHEHRWLIAQRPDRFDSYRRLIELFKRVRRPDASWCVAALLVTLGQADESERAFYERYKPDTMAEPQRMVDHTLWSHAVQSRMEEAEISRILELVYLGLGKNLNTRSEKDYGLKKKARIDLTENLMVASTIRNVVKMFGMQVPEVYRADESSGLEILQTNPPRLRVGTDFLTGRDPKELAYQLAKRLTYFQPSHIIATLYPREALESLYLAAASLVDPGYEIPMRSDVDPAAVQAIIQQATAVREVLEKSLTADLRQQLVAVMRAHWARGRGPNMGAWHRGIELTACHAGLVAAGDPAYVGVLIKQEASGLSKLKSSDKLKDMVHYVISEQYLALRRQLGVEIDYSDLLG